MLARHLLFLATRRPNQALLVIQPNEQVSTTTCNQPNLQQQQPAPPPYVGPPQVHKFHDDYQQQSVYADKRIQQHQPVGRRSNDNHNGNRHRQPPPPTTHSQRILEPYQRFFVHDKRNLQPHLHCSNNQNIYAPQPSHSLQSSQFFTLPNRRVRRDVVLEPPRSITPDITRGLTTRDPLGSAQMLARQGQQLPGSAEKLAASTAYQQAQMNDLNRKNQLEQLAAQQQQQRQASLDVRTRFASPVGLSALGYRLFASPIQDGPKSVPISPIGPEQANGFKSSTPTQQQQQNRATPTVAERLALQSQRCISPNPALVQATSTPSSSGNIVLSPIKTTMSNEELFTAIHKSKRRLNIKDDPESLSPAGSLVSLANKNHHHHHQQQQQQQQMIGTRHSWSPESHKVPEIPKSAPMLSATSRMDFKRLLLQQSIKSGPIRVSAAEQLKLSRQQGQEQDVQLPQTPTKVNTSQQLSKVMSPRSAWRFQTPRTDVLSSTIIEDAAAEEKAMKPSPELTDAVSSRLSSLNSRRQLDLSTGQPAVATKSLEELKNRINDSKSQQRSLEKRDKELENRLQLIDANNADDPIKAIESRRISNQLARAQFLASSSSISATPSKALFDNRFRARSESPQQNDSSQRSRLNGLNVGDSAADNSIVTRSPSAPALETAL